MIITSSSDLTQSTLALLVAWIAIADHTYNSITYYNFTVTANFFY
jgi:hypothetical protein